MGVAFFVPGEAGFLHMVFKTNTLFAILGIGQLGFMLGCSPLRSASAQTRPPPKPIVEAVSDEGVDNGASFIATLAFDKGKSVLDQTDTQAVNSLIDLSLKSGKVKTVKLLGFSDESPASKTKHDFLKRHEKLAEARIETIQKYIRENYPQIQVDLINMVEEPEAMERLVESSDANVRKTLEDAGLKSGKEVPSRVVVVSIVKKN